MSKVRTKRIKNDCKLAVRERGMRGRNANQERKHEADPNPSICYDRNVSGLANCSSLKTKVVKLD